MTYSPQQAHMGQPVPNTAPQPPTQAPKQVGAAAAFLIALAVLTIAAAVVEFAAISAFVSNFEDKTGATLAELDADVSVGGATYTSLAAAALLIIMALLVRAGVGAGRVIGLVLAILSILGTLVGMILTMVVLDDADTLEYLMDVTGLLPGWYAPAALGIGVLQIVVAILAIVKLANKQAKQWMAAKKLAAAVQPAA
ncbi:MAG: hypothetical protein ACRDXX_14420 [Stackebrandtia sp.]